MIRLLRKCFRTKNQAVRDFLSEFLATFFLVVIAIGSGAQYVLSRQTLSSYLTVNFAGGMGLALGIYFGGGVSDAINHYDNGTRSTTGPNSTAGIFVTFPQEFVSTTTAYFDEVFCTFILVGASLAITDPRNMLPNNGFLPVALGSVVFAIGTSFGFNSGYAINPARDLSPRIFIALAGWGTEPFTFRNYYFWVPVIGPMTGGFVASLLYSLLIEIHWPQEETEKEEDVIEKPEINEISNGQANKTFMKEEVTDMTQL